MFKTKERENSLIAKYTNQQAKDFDNLVENSAYLKEWKELVHSPINEIRVVLKFSGKLKATNQIYSNIANEIYSSNLNVHIVQQTNNAIIVQLDNPDYIIRQCKNK